MDIISTYYQGKIKMILLLGFLHSFSHNVLMIISIMISMTLLPNIGIKPLTVENKVEFLQTYLDSLIK
jgi:hypothetical protein